MNETLVTIVGNAATGVRYSTTSAGVPLASFRLASTERRYDRQRGSWVDGETSFVTVWAWRWMAENVVSSVSKGDPLVVTGKMRVRDREQDGKRTITVDVDAWALGHDLARGTSAFRRAVRARPEAAGGPAWGQSEVVGGAGGTGGAGAGGVEGVGGVAHGDGAARGGGAVARERVAAPV